MGRSPCLVKPDWEDGVGRISDLITTDIDHASDCAIMDQNLRTSLGRGQAYARNLEILLSHLKVQWSNPDA